MALPRRSRPLAPAHHGQGIIFTTMLRPLQKAGTDAGQLCWSAVYPTALDQLHGLNAGAGGTSAASSAAVIAGEAFKQHQLHAEAASKQSCSMSGCAKLHCRPVIRAGCIRAVPAAWGALPLSTLICTLPTKRAIVKGHTPPAVHHLCVTPWGSLCHGFAAGCPSALAINAFGEAVGRLPCCMPYILGSIVGSKHTKFTPFGHLWLASHLSSHLLLPSANERCD